MMQQVWRGRGNDLAGRAAEAIVAGDYDRRGREIIGRRWRGQSGEIDLIARDGEEVVFVEVKKAGDFDRAAERLGPRQIGRICAAAAEYIGRLPLGQLTPVRFDLALVDGRGAVRVIENAFAA